MTTEHAFATPGALASESATAWEMQAIRRAHLLHSQLDAARLHARKSKLPELHSMDFLADDSPYMQQLLAFYREHLQLARLLDHSDLLLHAEGPGAANHNPSLSAVNWLCTSAEKHLKRLMQAMLPMSGRDSLLALSGADLRLTGLAQGSLYAGFCLAGLHTDAQQNRIEHDDQTTLQQLRQAIHALPMVPQFVGQDGMNRDILEALPDPALRDAAMLAAHDLAPTGKKGIHTVEISAPTATDSQARLAQPLGQRERVVLGDALNRATMVRNTTHGSFVGLLRAIDLDRSRITLRHISADIPALRCVLPKGVSDSARQLLDRQVRVEGDFETNAAGQPRMMRVHTITAVPVLA